MEHINSRLPIARQSRPASNSISHPPAQEAGSPLPFTGVALALKYITGLTHASNTLTADTGEISMTTDLTRYVNLRYGVDNDGNTVIGPQRPNASVNPAPDTQGGSHSGYFSGNAIRGFSQIHASGTGYGKYGQFLLSPQLGLNTAFSGHDSAAADEHAACCEYSVLLARYGIRCAVTPAEHAAIYRFTYPASPDASLLIDLAHSIPLLANIVNTRSGISASRVALQVGVNDEGCAVFSGSGVYEGGFGGAHGLHFHAVVRKRPTVIGTYDADGLHEDQTGFYRETLRSREESVGGFMRFETEASEDVYVKIGVSFTSSDKARAWLEKEIPGWDYEAVREETRALWNQELHKIRISGDHVTDEDRMKHYTALYHAMCMPRDRSGDLPGYGDDVPMIDDHYAVWDTWRTLFPLYTLIKPDLVTKTVNSFIARHARTDYVRDTFVAGVDMYPQQGGDDVDNIICDAYVKGVEGVDWDQAYQVVKNHADRYRIGWYSYAPPVADANAPYYRLGYIPDDHALPGTQHGQMACSYTLEQAYNDHCAATMARQLGTQEDYEAYAQRSRNWRNLWNPNARCGDFTGFICPRRSDGTWVEIDPGQHWGSWVKHFYEATAYNYSFFVPHDVPGLIEKCGGEDAFIRRLLHGIETGLVDYGNEPAFLASYLFACTSKPWLVTDSIDKLRTLFTLEGPPGNDDSGAMSSWYIFSSVGFFPNAGQNLYYLTSPRYDQTVITLPGGAEIILRANNLSAANRYIQSVRINGQPWHSTMFTHDVIRSGAVIEYDMGAEPVNYARSI